MISGSHPDNLVCAWMRPTSPSKKVTQIVRVIQPPMCMHSYSYIVNRLIELHIATYNIIWYSYLMAQNFGGGKLWRNECHSPIFYPCSQIPCSLKQLMLAIVIHQHFPCQNSKRSIHQSFTPPKFCAIRQLYSYIQSIECQTQQLYSYVYV